MRCPIDGETLLITDRQGIEIDYCPRCRGVWLDRGELDKVIERSGTVAGPDPVPVAARGRDDVPAQSGERRASDPYGRRDDRHDDDDDDRHPSRPGEHGKRPKRRSFLEDIFDFG